MGMAIGEWGTPPEPVPDPEFRVGIPGTEFVILIDKSELAVYRAGYANTFKVNAELRKHLLI